MADLQASAIADLIKNTLRELGKGKFEQIAQTLQSYEVMGKWLKRDVELQDGGYGLQKAMMMKTGGTARNKGRYARDKTNVPNLMEQLKVDFVSADAYWPWEYVSDMLMNKGAKKIVDSIKARRAGAWIDMADLMEGNAWTLPTPAESKTDPFGIPYWIVQNSETGFNGAAPSGYSTVGNISPTTYPKWKNYTTTFGSYTHAAVIKPLRTMHRAISWKSPVGGYDEHSKEPNLRVYTDETMCGYMEDFAEDRNENLGKDLAAMNAGGNDLKNVDGDIMFKRHSIIHVPYLTENTTNHPIYMIDHGTFMPVVLKGDNMRESEPIRSSDQHDVYNIFVDHTYNFVCVNRRRNGASYKV